VVRSHRSLLAVALAGGSLLAAGVLGSPAAGAVTPGQPGLYGSADPTYDATFRQSLALLAHAAAGTDAPAAAVSWLVAQQCSDGGFQAFRPSTSVACTPSDPVAYAGEDTNSTALAALALRALGRTAAADRALAWLEGARNSDGGFPYFAGGSSDANSTADVLIALNGAGAAAGSTGPARAFLETLQIGCAGAATGEDGAFAFQDYGSGLVANDGASVQVVVALSGSGLPVSPGPSTSDAPRAVCPAPVPAPPAIPAGQLAAGYVERLVEAYSGAVPQLDYSSGTRTPGSVSTGDTAWAVLGLSAAGVATAQRDAALATVTSRAGASTADDDPGLLALAALAVRAAGGSTSAVTAYVERIDATMRTAATPAPSTTATPSPTPSATASLAASPTGSATGDPTDEPTAQSGAQLPPTGGTALTPALAGVGGLLLALGLPLVAVTRRRGAHA
jgi:hypothetical protein